MNGVQYYRKYTLEQLHELQQQIMDDPKNQADRTKTLYLYTPKARKKLDAIGWGIYYHLKDKREAKV